MVEEGVERVSLEVGVAKEKALKEGLTVPPGTLCGPALACNLIFLDALPTRRL